MKWVCYWLVLANIGYAAWYLSKPYLLPEASVQIRSVAQGAQFNNLKIDNPALLQSISEPAQQAVVPVAKPRLCWQIGAFDSPQPAQQVAERLSAMDMSTTLVEQRVVIGADYWIYMGPYANPQEAQQQLAQLHARNIDSFLIAKGELKDGISLGLFSQQDNAQRQRDRYAQQGVDAKIKAFDRFRTDYWLTMDAPSSALFNEGVMASIQSISPQLQSVKRECA